MMRLGDRIMDQPTNMGSQEDVVTDIFGSAGRDHQIVHDHILGTHGDNGNDFLNDVNNYRWHDDGRRLRGSSVGRMNPTSVRNPRLRRKLLRSTPITLGATKTR